MIEKLRSGIAKLAALGAVKRRGVGGLQAYGGTISGKGHVISAKTGEKTEFVLEGHPGPRNQENSA